MLLDHVTMPPGRIFKGHSASIATNMRCRTGTSKLVRELVQYPGRRVRTGHACGYPGMSFVGILSYTLHK